MNQIINSHVHIEKFYQLDNNKVELKKENFQIHNNDTVEFQNLNFRYFNSDVDIFENLNFVIKKNWVRLNTLKPFLIHILIVYRGINPF